METLDVGSGPYPKGIVNVDLNRKFKPTVVAVAGNLPFKGSVFDEVYLSHILEHVVDPENILTEVHRVLKTSKCVKIVFPNFASFGVFVAWFLQFHVKSSRTSNLPHIVPSKLQTPYNIIYGSHTIGEYDVHHVPLTMRLIFNLLQEIGFDIEAVKGEGFLLPHRRAPFVRALSTALAKMFPTRADIITIVASKKEMRKK
jgi:SAM-dependent methyltransferase